MKSTIIGRKCKDCWYYGTTVHDKYHKREWCYWKGAYVCGSMKNAVTDIKIENNGCKNLSNMNKREYWCPQCGHIFKGIIAFRKHVNSKKCHINQEKDKKWTPKHSSD